MSDIIPAQKKKVIVDFDEYEKLWDFVYRVACKDVTAPCGKLVERAKELNRFKEAQDKVQAKHDALDKYYDRGV